VKGDICRPTKGLLAEGACGGTGGGAGAKETRFKKKSTTQSQPVQKTRTKKFKPSNITKFLPYRATLPQELWFYCQPKKHYTEKL